MCVLVLKLLKLAKSVRALLDTVVQALPEVGNLGLLFFLLFFIFAALGVELFGRVGTLSDRTSYVVIFVCLPTPTEVIFGSVRLPVYLLVFCWISR